MLLLTLSLSLLLIQSIMPWGRSSSVTSIVTFSVTASVLLAVALYLASLLLSDSWVPLLHSQSVSHADRVASSNLGCKPRHFKIGTMPNCAAWLQCLQVNMEIRKLKLIGQGVVKKVTILSFMP